MPSTAYLTRIHQVNELTPEERTKLSAVTDQFAFRSNSYYQSLIDWDDPDDPIRQIIIPKTGELVDWGMLDASNESSYMVAPGVEHKYRPTALLLVTDVCGGYCRFCFRKRLFMPDNDETLKDVSHAIRYIQAHSEITNVLLTGGDPLVLSTRRLANIIGQISTIGHIRIVRMGSKMPAFNPARITQDTTLLEMIREFSRKMCIYVITHFNHPRELTPEALRCLKMLQLAGATTANQTPVIRGVNDTPEVLRQLFSNLAACGTPPYYVFQCRPTLGNSLYSVPVEEAYEIFATAQADCSGLAKRARFMMSHWTGKIEVIGLTPENIYMRYHECVNSSDVNRVMICRRNRAAYWADDYEELHGLKATPEAGQNRNQHISPSCSAAAASS
jgi:lysine 2,3-aminomutase